MKTLSSQNFRFWLVFALLVIRYNIPCFAGEAKSAAAFEKQRSEAEDLWKAGRTTDYYLIAGKIAVDMKNNPAEINLNKVAAKLFDDLISKEVDPKEVGTTDLRAMGKLAPYLTSHDNVSIDERRTNARLLSRYLGKIRKEIVPNYKWKPGSANVHTPIGTPMAHSGMDPEAIKDPLLKAKYIVAIQENIENNRMNSRQSRLSSNDRIMSWDVIDYITETFNAGEISSPLFTECVNSARLTNEEKKEVVKKISQKSAKKAKKKR